MSLRPESIQRFDGEGYRAPDGMFVAFEDYCRLWNQYYEMCDSVIRDLDRQIEEKNP